MVPLTTVTISWPGEPIRKLDAPIERCLSKIAHFVGRVQHVVGGDSLTYRREDAGAGTRRIAVVNSARPCAGHKSGNRPSRKSRDVRFRAAIVGRADTRSL
jgi:hypothetical protein